MSHSLNIPKSSLSTFSTQLSFLSPRVSELHNTPHITYFTFSKSRRPHFPPALSSCRYQEQVPAGERRALLLGTVWPHFLPFVSRWVDVTSYRVLCRIRIAILTDRVANTGEPVQVCGQLGRFSSGVVPSDGKRGSVLVAFVWYVW